MEFFKTDRLIVRRFEEIDATGLLDYFAEPRVNCFANEKLANLDEARVDVEKKSWDKSQFAVCLKDDGILIGNLFAIEEGDSYSVGWNFNKKFEGKGYAREAATGLIKYLFITLNARRIYCSVEEDNLRSQGLCKRLGFREEGTFLEYISFVKNENGTQKYENTMQFAMLKKEWDKNIHID